MSGISGDQNASQVNGYHINDDQLQGIKEAFNVYDSDADGTIPTTHLGAVFKTLGYNVRKEELLELVESTDTHGSGKIEFEDFVPMVARKMKEKEDEAFYKNLFRILDKKSRGFIGVEDLRYILKGLADAVELTDEEIDDMITEVDEDGNGEVSFDEFYTLMTSE